MFLTRAPPSCRPPLPSPLRPSFPFPLFDFKVVFKMRLIVGDLFGVVVESFDIPLAYRRKPLKMNSIKIINSIFLIFFSKLFLVINIKKKLFTLKCDVLFHEVVHFLKESFCSPSKIGSLCHGSSLLISGALGFIENGGMKYLLSSSGSNVSAL